MSSSRAFRIPQPSRHKGGGQAAVRLNGKDHYLGVYGNVEAEAAYECLISQWLANGRQPLSDSDNDRPWNSSAIVVPR